MFRSVLRLIRPTQWLKNGLLLAPLIFAGVATDVHRVELAFLGVALFCLLSSAVYVFNDLFDLKQDLQHPLKRNRPLPAGEISRTTAIILLVLLTLVGLGAAFFVNMSFFWISVAFVLFNFLYSIWLKHVVIVDVMSIAISFVLRAYAGALAVDVPASKWLLINTLLLALFLGFGKRRHELVLLEEGATAHRKILDKYSPYLLDQLTGVVTASVVVMYMLYSFSPEVSTKLGTQNLFLTIPFVVYGIFRYLYLIHKEDQGGSPTRVLISDKPILMTVVFWILTVIIVLYVL
ncbi:MAG TPA: decaprenyl-phosphate phosphoribosyltransferase [candidate division Zixibacteria bacterium]|nr:decaprenyl-phosphate phosphoribosyltransferase [candidate division Zixibacteria bacterium]